MGDPVTCERMVRAAVESYGGVDLVLNNAGVIDGVLAGAAIDYHRQNPLILAPLHQATSEYWTR